MIQIDLPKLPPDTNMLYLVRNKSAESYHMKRQLQLIRFEPIPNQEAVEDMIQNNHMFITQSDEALEFKSLVVDCLQHQNRPELIQDFKSRPDDPVKVEIVCNLTKSRQRRRDLDNYLKCLCDALVQCGLLKDDNCEKLVEVAIRNELLPGECKCRVFLAILSRNYCGAIGGIRMLDFGICETHNQPMGALLAVENDRIQIDLMELPPSLHKHRVFYGSNDDQIRIRFNFYKDEFMSYVESCLRQQVSGELTKTFKSRHDAHLKLTVICSMTEWHEKARDLDNCLRSVCSALVICGLLKDNYSEQLREITTRLPICADRFPGTCKCRIILDFAS